MKPINSVFDQLLTIPEYKFNIYLPHIKLTKGEFNIIGTGSLSLSEDGYSLKLMNAYPPKKEEEGLEILMSIASTDNIPRIRSVTNFCYSFTASDSSGNQYRCEYVDAGDVKNRILYTCTFKSEIIISSSDYEENEVVNAAIVFQDKYSFGTNYREFQPAILPTNLEDSGEWKHAWIFDTQGLKMTLHKNTQQLHLDIQSENSNITNIVIRRIIDSLNFVMGMDHQQYYAIYFGKGLSISVVLSTSLKKNQPSIFTAPYQKTGSNGDEAQENSKLFNKHYSYLELNPACILPKLHKRIVDSGSGYYYRYGLVISIAIEKLLTSYFPKLPESISQQVLNDIETLRLTLKDIKERSVLSRTNDFIKGLENINKYIPAKMLHQLESESTISPGSVKSWQKLRHAYAHGDDFNDELQTAVNLVGHNVTIYYELIFTLIKYEGRYTCCSKNDGYSYKRYPLTR